MRGWLGLFGRGLAMGVAEVIPGVSGGTIAFITGIYDRLLAALAAYSQRSLKVLFGEGIAAFWRIHDLTFLAVLAGGMTVSFVAFARIMQFLLDAHGLFVWGFFFGLIAGSVVGIGRDVPARSIVTYGIVGIAAGVAVSTLGTMNTQPGYLHFLLGGALAVCAWILPGISGSFVLLLLGLYAPFLEAVNDLRVDIVATMIAGMAAGLLVFAKLVSYMIGRWRAPVIALLTGLMAGSLVRLWPWRVEDALMTPAGYRTSTGEDPMTLAVVTVAVIGVGVAMLLARVGRTANH